MLQYVHIMSSLRAEAKGDPLMNNVYACGGYNTIHQQSTQGISDIIPPFIGTRVQE